MGLHNQMLLVAIVGLSVLHCPSVSADDQSSDDYSRHDSVPLSQDDLREITAQVLAKEPLLSSSPGIKHASATRFDGSEDEATVFYYPHSENAGIKQAFNATEIDIIGIDTWNGNNSAVENFRSTTGSH